MTRYTLIALLVTLATLLTGLLYVLARHNEARMLVAVPFLLLGPGLALGCLLRIGDALTAGTLAVAASLGLEAVVATGLLAGGWWSPGRALAIVMAFTLAAIVGSLVVDHGQRRGKSDQSADEPTVTAPGRTA